MRALSDAPVNPSPLWADILFRLKTHRVVACEWNGVPAFAKRLEPRHPAERLLLYLCSGLLRRWLAGTFRFAPKRNARARFEVVRLIELSQAGERVPRVLASTEEAFVIEAVGISLEALLARSPSAAQRHEWVARAAEDLAQFHLRGHWHGCAHIRNVGVSATGLARFDFDRDLDRYFPLALLQALDAVLFLSSLESLHDEAALGQAARSYAAVAPIDALASIHKVASTVERLARSGVLQRLAPKEAARVRALASALTFLGASSPRDAAARVHEGAR